jgi:hypothetical protein
MKTLFPLLLVPLILLAACGDDDADNETGSTDVPATTAPADIESDGYFGGVRDVGLSLNDALGEAQPSPDPAGAVIIGPVELRAQAAAYREFASSLQALEPPQDSAAAQADFIFATVTIADDLEAVADAIEAGDPSAEEAARAALVDNTIAFLSACQALGLDNCDALAPAN